MSDKNGRTRGKASQIEIADVINVLLDARPETYPFERNIALSIFCAWLHDPDDRKVLLFAQTVAAANVYIRCKDPRRRDIPLLSIDRLAHGLADPPIGSDFVGWFEALGPQVDSLRDIVAFFMHCPDRVTPSLNRAFHFIENNGFLDLDVAPDERPDVLRMKRAKTTLKSIWKARAHTGPFIWAAALKMPQIVDLAPDDASTFRTTLNILKSPTKLRSYFETAKWCQARLQARLDPAARDKVRFISLPANLGTTAPRIGSFDQQQMKIFSTYTARRLREN
ncbi:hypothetical protein [Bradyrhizobium icense]|uniref:hypothetical protein n=1 Tax=Bradyrhizobium icense TaxID=1274631 RepID=UPI0012EA7A26|nr:hypothetical protein [Bradyrhizobium icense]